MLVHVEEGRREVLVHVDGDKRAGNVKEAGVGADGARGERLQGEQSRVHRPGEVEEEAFPSSFEEEV